MRIALIGQSAFGVAVLQALSDESSHDVVGVFAAPDSARGAEPLADAAREQGLPVWQFARMRDEPCIDAFTGLDAELCVMAYVTDIVPEAIIGAPTLGTIQYHPSLLPKHRGPSAINWAIIDGDSHTGITIFWPDAGLDTGPILLQREVEIGPDESVGSLYFEKLFPMGVQALVEAVEMVADGTAPRIAQDESQATYEGWCGSAESQIDWRAPTRTVHDLIRGCDPQPGAWSTTERGKRVRLYGSRVKPGDHQHAALPGTVRRLDDDGAEIRAGVGSVVVQRARVGDGEKLPIAESGLRGGEVLG